mgnify:CR=1 FL=1
MVNVWLLDVELLQDLVYDPNFVIVVWNSVFGGRNALGAIRANQSEFQLTDGK